MLDDLSDSQPLSETEVARRNALTALLWMWLKRKERYWYQLSRARASRDKDKNKYFRNMYTAENIFFLET